MAMLAHKSSMPVSAGLGASSASSASQARDYQASTASHSRTPLTGSTQNGTFASPTESEFSEAYDGSDPVRYIPPISLCTFERFARQCERLAREHNLPLRYDQLPLRADQLPFRQYRFPLQKDQEQAPSWLYPVSAQVQKRPVHLDKPLPLICEPPAQIHELPAPVYEAAAPVYELPALECRPVVAVFEPPVAEHQAPERQLPSLSPQRPRFLSCPQLSSHYLEVANLRAIFNSDPSTWDERRVGEWLRSISCGQYAESFKGETPRFVS